MRNSEFNANKSNFKGTKLSGKQTNFTTSKGRQGFIIEGNKNRFTLATFLKCVVVVFVGVVLFELMK